MTPRIRVPAGARRVVSGPAGGRPLIAPIDRLERASSRLDNLIREVRCIPARSHRQIEERVAEAEAIADEIRSIFRSPGRPENPPLEQRGGKAWW